ncbi:hypothetical protein D3C78_1231870 [compost metagenome]
MVRHIRTDNHIQLATAEASGGVIQRFVETVTAFGAILFQRDQVIAGGVRVNNQRHHRSVRRNHHIVTQPAPQAQPWHAKGVVLIVLIGIEAKIAGFGNAPGHAALLAPGNLSLHCRPAHLHQQRVRIGGHHQLGHQVFKHRPTPRHQCRFMVDQGEQAAKRKPTALGYLVSGDGDIVGQTDFRGQQIVLTAVHAVLIAVKADGQ